MKTEFEAIFAGLSKPLASDEFRLVCRTEPIPEATLVAAVEIAQSLLSDVFDCAYLKVMVVGIAPIAGPKAAAVVHEGDQHLQLSLAAVAPALFDHCCDLFIARGRSKGVRTREDQFGARLQFFDLFRCELRARWEIAIEALEAQVSPLFTKVAFSLLRDEEALRARRAIAMASAGLARRFQLCESMCTPAATDSGAAVGQVPSAFPGSHPRFGGPVHRSTAGNSSPFVVDFHDALALCRSSDPRMKLMRKLQCALRASPSLVDIQYVLIGGSLMDPVVAAPADLDAVFYYRLTEPAKALDNAVALEALTGFLKACAIDARLVAMDSDPIHLIRMTSFMTSLYCASKDGLPSSKGMLLLDARGLHKVVDPLDSPDGKGTH